MSKADVLELSRKDKIWVCSECQKEYKDIPSQCACGAAARAFDEKDVLISEEAGREDYTVLNNIIYDGQQVNAGKTISLVKNDRATKSLLKHKNISPVEKGKK